MSLLPWMTGAGRVGLGSKRCGPSASPPLGWTHYLALPGRLDPSEHQDLEGNSPVQVPLLDGAGHDQTAEEEEVGVQEVYWAQTLLEGRMPKKGKRMMGSKAVTERGRASVHQYTAMSRMTNRQRPSCRGEMQAQEGQQSFGWQREKRSWSRAHQGPFLGEAVERVSAQGSDFEPVVSPI